MNPRRPHERTPQTSSVLALGLMALLSFRAPAGEPHRRPVLLHSLPPSVSGEKDPFGGAIRHIGAAFEARSLELDPGGRVPPRTALVWLVLPGDSTSPVDRRPDVSTTASAFLRHVEEGGALLLLTHRAAGEPGSPLASAILSKLGMVQGPGRTGAKRLRLPERVPLIGGLTWMPGGLTPIDTEESPALVRAVLVPNDTGQPTTVPGAPDYAGLAMLWGEFGRGRIGIVADIDWVRDGAFKDGGGAGGNPGGNPAILDRLVRWLTSTPGGAVTVSP